ncbi:MAG: hypothetical protein Q9214_000099 [Letrouitia sp. 1 TL-2023]
MNYSAPPLPRRLVGVSTKMYFDLPTTESYIRSLLSLPPPPSDTALFFIPSFPLIPLASSLFSLSSTNVARPSPTAASKISLTSKRIDPTSILLGAQDCSPQNLGPHTGETSPLLLRQLSVSIVELGHAERRSPPFSETLDFIAQKAVAVVRNGLIPLVCIGESTPPTTNMLSESVGRAVRECEKQVLSIVTVLRQEGYGKRGEDGAGGEEMGLVFAYEPFWAIGGEKSAAGDYVKAVVEGLREVLKREKWKGEVRFLYGGSAGPGTWSSVGRGRGGVDGLFLGRFAHEVENLERILEEVGQM